MCIISCYRASRWMTLASFLLGMTIVSTGAKARDPVAMPEDLTVTVGTQGSQLAGNDRFLKGPSLVMSGFSGTNESGDGFINLEGASVSVFPIDGLGAFEGKEAKRPAYVTIPAGAVGQIFGIALDDAEAPSLYLTATSAYGLPISGADQNGDGQEDKLLTGRADARFMEGLFGPNPDNAPGSVWKVDGVSGEVSLFASIKLAGKANAGPALGNIAFDKQSQQLFVSDLETGMIFRLDMDGNVLEAFDHGTTARSLAGLPKVPHEGTARLDIRDPSFDVEDPESWHFAPAERRVWGLAAHEGRLFYAVADGPEIWSVGIAPGDGGFLFDARKELILPDGVPPLEITDIAFGPDGSMILAQRGERVGSFDFSKVTKARRAEVLRFVKERDDSWRAQPEPYAIGFASQYSNGTGGVALGPDYDANGKMDADACQNVLWSSGERLRFAPNLDERLKDGGAMRIDGVQAQPFDLSRQENSPPWKSHFIDYDGAYPDRSDSGLVGDVEVYGCQGIGYQPPEEQPEQREEEPPVIPLPDQPAPPELSILKRSISDCSLDRANRTYRCAFSIAVTNRGDRAYTDSLMVTDSFSGTDVIDVRVSRGRDWHCSRVIGASVLCLTDRIRIEAGETHRLTLDMRLAAPPRDRRFDNCALLGVGQTPVQQVTAAQMLIEANGIRSGGVDGRMGPNTRRGLEELQALLGMAVTGDLSPALFANAGTPIGDRSRQSCVDVPLQGVPLPPPPVVEPPEVFDPPIVVPLPDCNLRSTRPRGNRCSCRYDGMRKISPTQCVCPRGSRLVPGRGCVDRPRPQPVACDQATTIQRGKACLCRYDNMVRRSPVACACPRGTKLRPGRGCVRLDRPRPPRCDARTTVLRNNRCDCRYPFMAKTSNTACRCLPGLKFVPGRGCQKVVVPQPPRCDGTTAIKRGEKCVCRYPNMRKTSRTSCACKPGARFLPGRGCVSLRPLRDQINPRNVVPLLRQ